MLSIGTVSTCCTCPVGASRVGSLVSRPREIEFNSVCYMKHETRLPFRLPFPGCDRSEMVDRVEWFILDSLTLPFSLFPFPSPPLHSPLPLHSPPPIPKMLNLIKQASHLPFLDQLKYLQYLSYLRYLKHLQYLRPTSLKQPRKARPRHPKQRITLTTLMQLFKIFKIVQQSKLHTWIPRLPLPKVLHLPLVLLPAGTTCPASASRS